MTSKEATTKTDHSNFGVLVALAILAMMAAMQLTARLAEASTPSPSTPPQTSRT